MKSTLTTEAVVLREIQSLHASILFSENQNLERAIRIGYLLTQMKKVVGHGNFTPWCKKNIEKISERTCHNYMAVYRANNAGRLKDIKGLTEAYSLLASKKGYWTHKLHHQPGATRLETVACCAGCPAELKVTQQGLTSGYNSQEHVETVLSYGWRQWRNHWVCKTCAEGKSIYVPPGKGIRLADGVIIVSQR